MTRTRFTVFRIHEREGRCEAHPVGAPLEADLENAADIAKLADEMLRDTLMDSVFVLHLDKHLSPLAIHRLPALPNPARMVAEVLRGALLSNADVLVYVHRRSDGDWSAGDQETVLVRQLRHAARMFDIELRDVIIVWSTPHELTFHSFRDDQLL